MDNMFSIRYISIDFLYKNGVKQAKTSDVTLLLMLDGQAQLSYGEKKKLFNQDDLVIINSDIAYSITKIMNSSNILVARFVISRNYLLKVSKEKNVFFVCDSREDSEKSEYREMRALMKSIIRDFAVNGLSEPSLMQCSDMMKLLHFITSYFMICADQNAVERDQERMREIRFFLEQNYDQEIGLPDAANHLGLTEAYLSRYMKKYFGTTLMNYLYDIRLEHAREDLEASKKSLTRISFDHGFPNLATFNKRFAEKYGSSPAEYRKRFERASEKTEASNLVVSKEAHKKLMDYFETGIFPISHTNPSNLVQITCDVEKYETFAPTWNVALNIGPAEAVLSSDVQQAILHARARLEIRYARIWSIFSPDMFILTGGEKNSGVNKFNRLFRVLDFLLGANIKPIIELGEKRDWIRRTASSNVRESQNKTLFRDYAHFLQTFDEMMEALVFKYKRSEISTWAFEAWDDKRTEVYHDKVEYIRLFKDMRSIIKKHVPNATLGGAGNYLGWSNTHTEESIKRWIDNNVFPDYLTFTYSPYRMKEDDERLSVLKVDEDDLKHTIDGLRRIMKKYGYPAFDNIYINEFNMTDSSRNYFNDSLWKAGYMAKAYIDNIGKTACLLYSQLSDATTDYYDDQRLLNGSGGLLTRDLIEKPAFLALRLMKHLFGYMIKKGDDYILTRDEYGNLSLLCFNFIRRNYLYYLHAENENTLENHYSYFENQEMKTFHFCIENVAEEQEFTLHHHVVNRQAGSIMDEWARFDFLDNLPIADVNYLRQVCIPKIYYTRAKSKESKLEFDLTLEPMEIRCVTIRKQYSRTKNQ